MNKREEKARRACAWSNFTNDCETCYTRIRREREEEGYVITTEMFHAERCKDWKWYLPFPLCIPARIKNWLEIRKIYKGLKFNSDDVI